MSEHAQIQAAQRTSSQGAKREQSAPVGEKSKFKPSVAKARGAIAQKNYQGRENPIEEAPWSTMFHLLKSRTESCTLKA